MAENTGEVPISHESTKSWEQFDNEREALLEEYKDRFGRIEFLTRTHGEYFVHSTSPLIAGGVSNHLLREDADWISKLAVLVTKHPTLSASSLRPDTADGTWNRVGVIMTSGRVEEAGGRDLGSYVIDEKTKATGDRTKREPGWTLTAEREYKEGLESALRHENSYNEYIVGKEPEFAGLYIRPDSLNGPEGKDAGGWERETEFSVGGFGSERKYLTYKEVFDVADQFGMSVFVFVRNMAHRASLQEDGTISLGEEVPPEKMLAEKYEVPEANRENIIALANTSRVPAEVSS